MISAVEAKKQSSIAKDVTKYTKEIERQISIAIKRGDVEVAVKHDIEGTGGANVCGAITEMLRELGYEINFEYARPKPIDCPEGQWDYNNGTIYISWK